MDIGRPHYIEYNITFSFNEPRPVAADQSLLPVCSHSLYTGVHRFKISVLAGLGVPVLLYSSGVLCDLLTAVSRASAHIFQPQELCPSKMSQVIPLSALDTLLGVDTNVTTQGFVIDSRIDIDKTRVTANALVKKWPYLGGKLHRNDKVVLRSTLSEDSCTTTTH